MSADNTNISLYHDDLPEGLDLGSSVAIDTETMGLNPHRDRLCLVQLSSGDGHAHLVKIGHPKKTCAAPCRHACRQKRRKDFPFCAL